VTLNLNKPDPPQRILIGPFSPQVHLTGTIIENPLNSLHCLGDYAEHPRIQPFFIAPEALAGSFPVGQHIRQVMPAQRL